MVLARVNHNHIWAAQGYVGLDREDCLEAWNRIMRLLEDGRNVHMSLGTGEEFPRWTSVAQVLRLVDNGTRHARRLSCGSPNSESSPVEIDLG
jgi:hypothetical protein